MNGRRDILWTAKEAAAATRGEIVGAGQDWRASGVSIDSRTVVAGDLFVAIEGPRLDGHEFVRAALARGAAAAMVGRRPDGLAADAPLLLVGDTLAALEDLGRQARARTRARVVGVTGSVGKTGTKEALRHVLGGQGRTAASEGGLNNHWGLPLSLARVPADADFGVFEMGMNHPGEIDRLTRMARPDVALITAVEAVHGAFFDGVEAIADAKAEIFAGVEPDGAAVLNADNPHFARLAARARDGGIRRIVGFGAGAGVDVRLVAASLDAEGSSVTARVDGRDVSYRVGAPGRHWVTNSLAVLATVFALGVDVVAAARALAGVAVGKGRGRRHLIRLPSGTFTLLDESYNASPVSVRAAIETLALMPKGPDGRRVAVLGDMLELGERVVECHRALAGPLVAEGIDVIFTAGPNMRHLRSALPPAIRGGHAESSDGLAAAVAAWVRPGDVVSVKGSAASRMGLVVEALLALGASGDAGAFAKAANGE